MERVTEVPRIVDDDGDRTDDDGADDGLGGRGG